MAKRKIDYSFKAQVLKSDIPNKIRKAELMDYQVHQFLSGQKRIKWLEEDYEDGIVHEYNENLDNLYTECCLEGKCREFIEGQKINKAFYNRLQRLKSRVSDIVLTGTATFVTMTFTDDILANTTPDTRRQHVRRFLKSTDAVYVANIDFGGKNGREHYHALISTRKLKLNEWHSYGGIKVKQVHANRKSSDVKLSKYIAKLTNHAIKETTKRTALIYSR